MDLRPVEVLAERVFFQKAWCW